LSGRRPYVREEACIPGGGEVSGDFEGGGEAMENGAGAPEDMSQT